MTGPEHYRKAEALLGNAWRHVAADGDGPLLHGPTVRADLLATAQVHATLALAAATAEPIAQTYCGDEAGNVSRAWSKAIS